MVYIAEVRTAGSSVDNGIDPYLSIVTFNNISRSIFSGTPDNTAKYSPVDLKILGSDTVVMIRIVHWRHTCEIFKVVRYNSVFLEKAGICIRWIYIAVSIRPGLDKIRCSSRCIGTSGARKFWSWNLVTGYRPISPPAVLAFEYTSLVERKYQLGICMVVIAEDIEVFRRQCMRAWK